MLTISTTLGVRGTDLVQGHYLNSANALTFSSGCKLSIDGMKNLAFDPGTRYVVATSSVSIAGTPTLSGEAAMLFSIESKDNAIALVAKTQNKCPALLPGEENAEANSIEMAKVELVDGAVVCFPAGEYHFSETIDFSTSMAKGVTFMSLKDGPCVLHAGLKLGAMENVVVQNCRFKGFDTPAVIATGTSGLTVEKCTLEKVKGSYGEAGQFPYALVNVTDFNLVDPTYPLDATGTTLWDGQAYFEGGTQVATSQALSNEVVVVVTNGVANNWWWLDSMRTNFLHLSVNAFKGKKLRKRGPATLDIVAGLDLAKFGVDSLEVEKGQYVARAETGLGVAKKPIHISNGGGLTLTADQAINERRVTFSGNGIGGDTLAVRFTSEAKWNKTQYVSWELEGDASMYNNCSGENGIFLWSTVKTEGYTLTLKGTSGANYRFGRSTDWYGGGTTIVDKVILSASAGSNPTKQTDYKAVDGKYPLFKFINGAKFLPDNGNILNLVRNVDFAAGTSIGVKSGVSGFELFFDSLTGAPAVSNIFTKLTINREYAARMADVKAGKTLSLESSTPLEFASGAKVSLVADKLEEPTQEYTLISAAGGITGAKPTLDASAKAAGWALYWGVDRKSLVIGKNRGMVMIMK